MAKGDLFSTVLRGFHKEQVSQYLNDLIRKYEREKEELNKKYEGISPNEVQELRQENDRLRRELEQEKTRNAELEQQKGKISPDHQEDQDLEKLRLLASQIKSRIEEARQMEQAARRESERIIVAARMEEQTILNKAKKAGSEGESALERRRPGIREGKGTGFKREKRGGGSVETGTKGCRGLACCGTQRTGRDAENSTAAIGGTSPKGQDRSGRNSSAGESRESAADGTDAG